MGNRRPLLAVLCLLALAFASLGLARSVAGTAGELRTLTVTASADTYLEAYGSEDRNYGQAPTLRVDQWLGRLALLRFSLNGIPRERRLLSARLELHVLEATPSEAGEFPTLPQGLALFDLETPWIEQRATFRTCDGHQPWRQGPGLKLDEPGPIPVTGNFDMGQRLALRFLPFAAQALQPGKTVTFDVTDLVRALLRSGTTEANLVLRGSHLAGNYVFASREAAEAEYRPRLVLSWDQQQPDFRLQGSFLTAWKPGQQAAVTLERVGEGPPGPLRWTISHRPAASRLEAQALQATTSGVTFQPDVPGHYQVRADLAPAGGKAPATAETADVYVLAAVPHPRLYLPPGRLEVLRHRARAADPVFVAFRARVEAGNTGLPQGLYQDFGPPEGCEDNALLYLITGEARYAKLSRAYAELILSKPLAEHFPGDLHAAAYLGAGWAQALALHYDWCYDYLSPEQRQATAAWLKQTAAWADLHCPSPVAHNDSGGRLLLLACAPAALLGDDPEAPALLARAHADYEQRLLPWLWGPGRGGRSGDGGEYEGGQAAFLIRYAWLLQTAAGIDEFASAPFYRAHLQHLLFGWYPRRLYDRTGAYSIREYYSPSCHHLRMGYSGDANAYLGAALLADHYRNDPAGRQVRWLAGEWPTRALPTVLKWGLLCDFNSIPPEQPTALAYLDAGFDTLYLRSDWSDDATWILFENGPLVSSHQGMHSGGFEIYKGNLLAARTGNYDHGNVGSAHVMNYLQRTVATNSLLIDDPQERWWGLLGGARLSSDGGGQRTNYPLSLSPDLPVYQAYRQIFTRGQIAHYREGEGYTYAFADLTLAYNSPFFSGGSLNTPKVRLVTRELLYLRPLDSVLIFDRVSSTRPEYTKRWLLHSLGDLEVLNGEANVVDNGEMHYRGANRFLLRYGWPKPVPSFARCLCVNLLPAQTAVARIGGRIDLSPGETAGAYGDKYHGRHQHRHLKDFWVNGTNYAPGNPPESRWYGDPTSEYYVPGTPDESGGRGKWRIEVSPAQPALDDVFFNVLCPRLGTEGPFPTVDAIAAGPYTGALVREGERAAAVFFARPEHAQPAFSANLPGVLCDVIIADLAPGPVQVSVDGRPYQSAVIGEDGTLALPGLTCRRVQVAPARSAGGKP